MKKSSKMKDTSITRRDFVGGTLIGSGAALLAAKAPSLANAQGAAPLPPEFPQTIAAQLVNLDESWTGPGGVGDYANANGNTHEDVNVAHTFRNRDFDDRINGA
ncbi:MAG: twin-arginine translocation signal domain-containing protein, partial [Pseudomonadota bacterium]|nr:twin-arginine translocation signal domain-containing protein [Pseudomonadota bacterium]